MYVISLGFILSGCSGYDTVGWMGDDEKGHKWPMGKEKHDVKEQTTVFAYQESIIDLVASLRADEVSYFLCYR